MSDNRGRPAKSKIRQRIVNILSYCEPAHGYEVWKIYSSLYPSAARRSIYYHLHRGCELGEIEVADVKNEEGDFSWGEEAEKVYYRLGDEASPEEDPDIEKIVNS